VDEDPPAAVGVPQGRNQVLDTQDHNQGFATWVLENAAYFRSLASDRLLVASSGSRSANVSHPTNTSCCGNKTNPVMASQKAHQFKP
jgi:hypothetical protein